MRTFKAYILVFALPILGSFAQDYPVPSGGTRPQIAYRLLTTWVDGYDRDAGKGKKIASTVLLSIGGLGVGAAGATGIWGDNLSQRFTGAPLDTSAKQGIILGAGIGGAALIVAGLVANSVPVENKRLAFADIFGERDPEVQEAMSVAALREQAAKGKERRVTAFISSLILPLLTGGIRVGINLAAGDPWSKDVVQNISYSSWSAASGIVGLFSKSKEELLYERYLTARDSLYGRPVGAP